MARRLGSRGGPTETIGVIGEMLKDLDWTLPRSAQALALASLSRAPDPDPLKQLSQQLRHELRAYQAFCRFREKRRKRWWAAGPPLAAQLYSKRKQLRARIQARQARELARAPRERRFGLRRGQSLGLSRKGNPVGDSARILAL